MKNILLISLTLSFTLFLTACGKPSGLTWQDYAIQTGDPSKCNKASLPDVCRAGFTQATGDGKACAAISDSAWKKTCESYDQGKTAQANISQEEVDDAINDNNEEETTKGDCKYDSECPAICQGNVAWKQGCNPREGICIKTFDTDCTQDLETFGSNSFGKVCSNGICIRDEQAIKQKKQELQAEKDKLKTKMRETSTRRANIIAAKDEANRNCLGGLSDATVILMNEFATKTAGIIAGGVSVAKDATNHVIGWTAIIPDYINKGLDDMKKAGTTEQKLTLDEYIILNCKLNEFFGNLLDESDGYLDKLLEEAKTVDAEFDSLP